MAKRPEDLGLEVILKTLDDVDSVLHELAWLANQKSTLAAIAKQKIDVIKSEAAAKAVVEIDGQSMTFDERAEVLETKLSKWVATHVAKHLVGKKRTVDLPHGKVGLRQQPLVALIADDASEATVLDAIDMQTGFVTAIRAQLEHKSPIGTARGSDLISIEIKPALKAMKDALESKKLTAEALAALGVSLREAYDEPVLTPTKTLVVDSAA